MTPEQIAELEALANFTNGEIVSMSPGPDGTPEHLEAFKEGWEGAMRLVRDALAPILAALKAQQPDEAMVARALAPHMEGGREFDQMPPDRMALRKWSREGMCNTNDATQDDALEAARAAIAAMQESRDETRRHSHRRPSEGGKNNLAQ